MTQVAVAAVAEEADEAAMRMSATIVLLARDDATEEVHEEVSMALVAATAAAETLVASMRAASPLSVTMACNVHRGRRACTA